MSDSVVKMRDQIITALEYPRLLMEREVKQRSCSQHYHFNAEAEECGECLYILECQAYSRQLAEPTLRQASTGDLLRLLKFGFEYVSYQLSRQDHDATQCDCDLCRWIRSATPLLDAAAA